MFTLSSNYQQAFTIKMITTLLIKWVLLLPHLPLPSLSEAVALTPVLLPHCSSMSLHPT